MQLEFAALVLAESRLIPGNRLIFKYRIGRRRRRAAFGGNGQYLGTLLGTQYHQAIPGQITQFLIVGDKSPRRVRALLENRGAEKMFATLQTHRVKQSRRYVSG